MPDTRPYPPQKVAEGIKRRILAFSGQTTSNGIRGAIIGLLNDACCGDEGRYYLLEYLFGVSSTKDLDDSQWYALEQWVKPGQVMVAEKKVWAGQKYLYDESQAILEAMGYNIDRRAYLRQKHGSDVKKKVTQTDRIPPLQNKSDLDRVIEQVEKTTGAWDPQKQEEHIMHKYEEIVPQEIRDQLMARARSDSDYLWFIADSALKVMDRFVRMQEKGVTPFIDYSRGDVWRALSRYTCKGAGRVKAIAAVGAIFAPDLRQRIEASVGFWEFGYYEAISSLPASQWDDIFQFLHDYQAGVIHQIPRRLGVDEFIFLYEKHILGLQKETILPDEPPCDSEEIAYSSGAITPSIPFQDLLRLSNTLKKTLKPYQDRASVIEVLFHLKEIQKILPKAMRDCGLVVPVPDPVDLEEMTE